MVKGITRQVIVVQSPDQKLFDQAIFILRETNGQGITDEALLREAKRVLHEPDPAAVGKLSRFAGVLWASCGALTVGLIWLLTALI